MFSAHKNCHDEINLLNAEIVKLQCAVSDLRFKVVRQDLELIHTFQKSINHILEEIDIIKNHLNVKYVDGKLISIKKCKSCHQEIKEKENV